VPSNSIPETSIQRFWSHVDKGSSKACWEWQASQVLDGYGNTELVGLPRRAHRAAWILAFGPIPEGFSVLHTCDNPPCVNPSHLFLGTQVDNMRDMVRKGRGALQGADHTGEKNPRAKLSESDAEEIWRLFKKHYVTKKQLAEMYGVAHETIKTRIKGGSWRHIRRDLD
jgi:hypothetical protein